MGELGILLLATVGFLGASQSGRDGHGRQAWLGCAWQGQQRQQVAWAAPQVALQSCYAATFRRFCIAWLFGRHTQTHNHSDHPSLRCTDRSGHKTGPRHHAEQGVAPQPSLLVLLTIDPSIDQSIRRRTAICSPARRRPATPLAPHHLPPARQACIRAQLHRSPAVGCGGLGSPAHGPGPHDPGADPRHSSSGTSL